MTTLLVGATGLLGSEIARRLTNQGRSVRALVRTTADPAKIAKLQKLGCTLVYGDLRDRASLDAACRTTDSLSEAFAALMLSYANGDVIDMRATLKEFPLALTTVKEFAARQLVHA